MGGGGGVISFSRDFSGDPGGDGNLGRPRIEELGVVPLEGGVALLDLEGGRLEGVAPLGGVIGGVAESADPLRWGFLGGLSGGESDLLRLLQEVPVPPLYLSWR